MHTQRPIIPETVARQLETIRTSGETNMLDRPAVMQIAYREGYYELVDWLAEHKVEYSTLIFTGATVEETGQDLRDVRPL